MLYSASWNESFIRSGGSTESMYLKAHLMRVLIGFVFMFIFFAAEQSKDPSWPPPIIPKEILVILLRFFFY